MSMETLIRQFEIICGIDGKVVSARYRAHDVEVLTLSDGTERRVAGTLQNWVDLSCNEENRYPLCLQEVLTPLNAEIVAQLQDARRALVDQTQTSATLRMQVEELGARSKDLNIITGWMKDQNIEIPPEVKEQLSVSP